MDTSNRLSRPLASEWTKIQVKFCYKCGTNVGNNSSKAFCPNCATSLNLFKPK